MRSDSPRRLGRRSRGPSSRPTIPSQLVVPCENDQGDETVTYLLFSFSLFLSR